MSLETEGFEFDGFLLDTKQKVLLREGKPVPITPKTFQLLLALVENHGRLVEKDELMKAVWADSFVEAGNLAFTMRLLRKALGDDTQKPRFIETVPRRGYRFIAEVRVVAKETDENNDSPPTAAQTPEQIPAAAPRFKKFAFPILALSIAVILIGVWLVKSKNLAAAPVLSAPFASEKLSTNGKVTYAVLSPDGKNVIYTNGRGSDKESIWVRQLENGSSVEIIPPSDDIYYGLAISPDGNTLYFVRHPRQGGEPKSIYRVSIFGGVPQKTVHDTQGWISLSPDGAKISFVRCYFRDDEFCSLMTADSADGKNEKRIVTSPRPIRIGDNRISPDGKSIAFAAGQSTTASNEFGLSEVDLESGAQRELTDEKFFDIKNLVWLPDKSGWLFTASKIPNKNFRIWQVSAVTGKAVALTKDSETYAVLGLDREATKIITTQFKQDFRLRLLPTENPSLSRILADASSVSFAPDGKVYFSSIMSGNDEIWSIKADGSEQRQLTNNVTDESAPLVSPDNNSVYFLSNQTGAAQMWRMNTDGSNQTQITRREGGAPVFISPDGGWVYYRHSLSSALWRVSTGSGEEQLVLDKAKSRFAVSPDGLQVAFFDRQGEERILTVVSLTGGQIIKTFRLADSKAFPLHLVWMPDKKNLAYISVSRENENNILWLQSMDGAAPQQIAVLGNEEMSEGFGLAVSPDGKSFAFVQGGWRHDAVLLKGLR
jgi:DNA-binding winged helix-turn-helix (wHTH) protein/Tol biopolymer transport system component